MDWLTALQSSVLAAALRGSVPFYLSVRVAHLLGVALMIGAIVPLNLRLLGLWRWVSPALLGRVLRGCAAAGLIVAIVSGALLFVANPARYAASDLFLAKMVLVGLGGANALLASRIAPADLAPGWPKGAVPVHVRLIAAASLLCWLAALVMGTLSAAA